MLAVAAVETKTVKIGTRGSPLALAQAYMTRDKLQVGPFELEYEALSLNVIHQSPRTLSEAYKP